MTQKKSIMTTETEISRIVGELGEQYGVDATVTIREFKDFKVRFQRTTKWIAFELSDYVLYLSTESVRALLERVFALNYGAGEAPYPAVLAKELLSEEFRSTCQPIFLRRSRSLTPLSIDSESGSDLMDIWAELEAKGLVSGPTPELRWSNLDCNPYCSTLFNVIAIPLRYQPLMAKAEIAAYLVYEQYCTILEGRAHMMNMPFDKSMLLEELPISDADLTVLLEVQY